MYLKCHILDSYLYNNIIIIIDIIFYSKLYYNDYKWTN